MPAYCLASALIGIIDLRGRPCGYWWPRTSGCSPTRSPRGCAGRPSPWTSPTTATAALERLGVNDYDVLVLDRDLPGVHGDEVCRAVVERGRGGRVLMLTAAGDGRATGWRGWASAPTTTCPSRSRSTSWSPGCARWAGAPGRPPPPVLERAGIRLDPAPPRGRSGTGGTVAAVAARSSRCWRSCCGRDGAVVSRRVAAGEGLGREHRPVHQRGAGDHDDAAPQARRAAGHRDRAGRRVPHPMKRCRAALRRAPAPGCSSSAGAVLLTGVYFLVTAEPRVPRGLDHPELGSPSRPDQLAAVSPETVTDRHSDDGRPSPGAAAGQASTSATR